MKLFDFRGSTKTTFQDLKWKITFRFNIHYQTCQSAGKFIEKTHRNIKFQKKDPRTRNSLPRCINKG